MLSVKSVSHRRYAGPSTVAVVVAVRSRTLCEATFYSHRLSGIRLREGPASCTYRIFLKRRIMYFEYAHATISCYRRSLCSSKTSKFSRVDRLDLRQTEIFRASTRTNPPSFVYLSDTIAITAGKNNQSEKMSLSVVGLVGPSSWLVRRWVRRDRLVGCVVAVAGHAGRFAIRR